MRHGNQRALTVVPRAGVRQEPARPASTLVKRVTVKLDARAHRLALIASKGRISEWVSALIVKELG